MALLELLSSSRQTILEKTIQNHWIAPGEKRLPGKMYSLKKRLSEIIFDDRETTFQQRNKYTSVNYYFLLYKIKYRPTLSSLKEIIKGRCHFIQNKQHLKEFFRSGVMATKQSNLKYLRLK